MSDTSGGADERQARAFPLLGPGLLVFATFLLCVFPLADPDFWWHLRTGQLIWERGALPRTDWYLFTDSDRPWIDLHWGFQLLLAAVHAGGGVNLVILIKALIYSAAVGLAWSAAGKELPFWLRAVVWIPAMISISGRAYERPEMLSLVFLAAWLWIALRAESGTRWVWALPVIQVVWINCHALFVLGLVVGVCFAIDQALRGLARGRLGLEPVAPTLRSATVLQVGTLCGLAAFVNPYLWDGAVFPWVLYRKFTVEQEFYSTRIGEFQSPLDFLLRHGFVNVYLNALLMLTLLAVTTSFALLAVCRRWSPFRWLLLAAFLNLGLEATRNVSIVSLVAATITAANFVELRRFWPTLAANSPRWTRRLNALTTAGVLVWMLAIVTGGWGQFARENKFFGFGERPNWFAHDAVIFAGQSGFPERAFLARIGLAGVYEYHHGPEKKVFMDPRLEVATQQTFQLWERILAQMSASDPSWEHLLRDEKRRLPVIVLDCRNSRTAIYGLLQTRGWRLVYADPVAAVFLSDAQADALQLTTADPRPLLAPP